MFRIKICGVTSLDDAWLAADAGADAIGLNFVAASPRRITHDMAQQIVAGLPRGVAKIGVFAGASARDVIDCAQRLNLDLVQLHGDEPPELLAQLDGLRVLKAFRCGPRGRLPIVTYLERCRRLGCMPRMVLLDADCKGEFGGTGTLADWSEAAQLRAELPDLPSMVLAGGLTPINVAAAIAAVCPAAVDTASGVERSVGRKDPQLVQAFVRAADRALRDTAAR